MSSSEKKNLNSISSKFDQKNKFKHSLDLEQKLTMNLNFDKHLRVKVSETIFIKKGLNGKNGISSLCQCEITQENEQCF